MQFYTKILPGVGKVGVSWWRISGEGALAFLLATMAAVWAQGPVGTLNGTVLDPDGFVVPGASLE